VKLLTKHTDYAIRAMLALAKNKGRYISCRELARRQDMPYQFLRRILHELIRAKLVVSQEGGSGGFKINADPKNINAADVIGIFQGNMQLSDCMLRKDVCAKRYRCVLRSQLKQVEKLVEQEFRKITLAKLMEV